MLCSTPKTPPSQQTRQACATAPPNTTSVDRMGRATLQHPKTPFPTSCYNFPSTPYQSDSVPPHLTGKLMHGILSLSQGKGADRQHPELGSRVRMVWPTLGCHPITGQPLGERCPYCRASTVSPPKQGSRTGWEDIITAAASWHGKLLVSAPLSLAQSAPAGGARNCSGTHQ